MRVCPLCGAANGACTPAGGAAPLAKPIVGSTADRAAFADLVAVGAPPADDPAESDPVIVVEPEPATEVV